jgi:hypothetical protein
MGKIRVYELKLDSDGIPLTAGKVSSSSIPISYVY